MAFYDVWYYTDNLEEMDHLTHLTIYDGRSNEFPTPTYWKYSGSTLPPRHISSGNEIELQFYSDVEPLHHITIGGFMLEYNPVSKYLNN